MDSLLNIRQALETALDGISPAIDTSWENMGYDPVKDVPYQEVYLIPAEPENPTFGRGGPYREVGALQVTLKYPVGEGPALTAARVGLIRAVFVRGETFTSGGVVVQIERTPEVLPYYLDNDRYCTPVRIRYFANV